MKLERAVNVLPPTMPNFIRTEQGEVVPVSDLTLLEIEAFAEFMKHEFIKHAKAKVADKRNKK